MKQLVYGVAMAVTIAGAASRPATAAVFPIAIMPTGGSADFGTSGTTSGTIADQFTFTVPAGSANGFVGSIALTPMLDVDFTSIFLDTTPFNAVLSDGIELFTLPTTALSAGSHTIFVNGTWGTGGGSYAGTLNYLASSVPEPASWALMIGGIGLIGGTMRRRRMNVKVAFA